jgi:hypothetical protein
MTTVATEQLRITPSLSVYLSIIIPPTIHNQLSGLVQQATARTQSHPNLTPKTHNLLTRRPAFLTGGQ